MALIDWTCLLYSLQKVKVDQTGEESVVSKINLPLKLSEKYVSA